MPYEELTGKNRRFWRCFIIFLCFMMLVGLYSDYVSRVDRQQLHTMQDRLEQQQLIVEATIKQQNDFGAHNRIMLDARAKCQLNLFNAVAAGRRFNKEELAQITELWTKAEYDKIQEKFIH